MADDIVVELIEEKIENHELSQPHGNGEDAECRAEVAALRTRIDELEQQIHVHDEEEYEEVEAEPTIEEV